MVMNRIKLLMRKMSCILIFVFDNVIEESEEDVKKYENEFLFF